MSARKKPAAVADPPAEVAPAVPAAPVAPTAAVPPRRAPVARAASATTPAAPKPARRRAPAASPTAPVVEPAAAPADPLLAEAPLDEAAEDLPPFLRHRAPRPAPPAVRILGEAAAARPTPRPAARPGAVPSDGPYAVYILGDPDGTIHYVGYSDNVSRRLTQHLNAAYNPRSRWLQALLDSGEQPRHKVVETVPTRADALAAEQKWIRCYRRAGHPLTNGLLPPEPRSGGATTPGVASPPAPPAQAAPPAGPLPRPARRAVPRAWLMSIGGAVLLCGLIVWGLGWSHLPPSGPQPGNGSPVGAAGLPTAVVALSTATPADLSAAPGALAALPTVATGGGARRAVTVQTGQTVADVAALLQMPPEALIAQLGRDTVYAGELVTSAGDAPTFAVLSQGGGPTPTVDVYNGKGVDAPIAPVIETTVLASTGLCPPGTARAGQPRDGRVVVPFEPGCAPEDVGVIGPQSQPWVPAPPLAQGGGPGTPSGPKDPMGRSGLPASLPAPGHADSALPGAADLLGAVADQAAALEQTAPEPVTYCADGSVRDLVHRVQAPFVPGCAPLPVGPPDP